VSATSIATGVYCHGNTVKMFGVVTFWAICGSKGVNFKNLLNEFTKISYKYRFKTLPCFEPKFF